MVYISVIRTGLLVFPFLAIVFTLPYAVFQYHKYGSVSKYRTLIIYSFILYMLIAFFMVSLPLPDRASTAGNTWQDHLNLIPFKQIWLYWHDKALSLANIKAYMVSMSLWQLLFNILLTVPFGVYMRYYFKLSLKRTILYSFLLSLFYETSQITALFGIYPGPYRLADVEDLICNTMGGAAGWQIAYVFTVMLPARDEIDAECRAAARQVTGMRRFWACFFDYVCCYILFDFLMDAAAILVPGFENYSTYWMAYNWTFFYMVSLIQVILTGGSTLGHGICRMILAAEGGGIASTGQLIRRYLYLWLFTGFPLIITDWLANDHISILNNAFLILALMAVSRLYFAWYIINMLFRKGAPMPHDRLSGTRYISTVIPEQV